MKLALLLPALPDRKWTLARQVGVNYAITKAAPELTKMLPPWDFESLLKIKTRFADAGFNLYGLEGDEFDMTRIKLGLPGRDEDIEKYRAMLYNMGALGIRLLCFNFMAKIGWFRTSVSTPERGGALSSSFDYDLVRGAPATDVGVISEAQLWDNLSYFLRAVVPVAEEAGVQLGMHPDDPPVSPLRGVGRILTSAAAFDRAMAICPSPNFGVTFCQATFLAMGEDVPALARRWGEKIFFVHFRDVRGTAEKFVETFHDNGPTDMPARLRLYHEIGFDGPIRPDHAPTMEGEDNQTPGYEILGRLFAIGYMKGIMHTLNIPVE